MKLIFLSLALALFTIETYAQATVTGKVLSTNDKQPLPYATVTIFSFASDSLISGTATNDQGRFNVILSSGEYTINVSYMGYTKTSKHITVGTINNILDLGNILLSPSTLEIGEVLISATKESISSSLDKKNYSVSDFAANSGGNALDIMKSLPGLNINQEYKVELRGSDKVIILIDGKQSAFTGFGDQKGLENIPASQIENIEIINNPSSKYDASGMAGIINIKLKQEKKSGFNGDLGVVLGSGAFIKRKADLPSGMPSYSNNMKYNPSLNLNYKTEKLNLFIQSFGIKQHKLPNNEFTKRHYGDGTIVENQVAENRSQKHYNVKLGLDWSPTSNHSFSLFGLYDYEWHIDTTRVWYFTNMDYNNPTRKWGFNESEGTGFSNITLRHKYNFDQPGHEINSQFLFTKGWENETYNLYQNGPFPNYPIINSDKTQVIAPEFVYQIHSDYTKPFSFGRFETGMQARIRHMPITYTMTKNDDNTALIYNLGDWSKWNENLLGVYTNIVMEFKRIGIEAGLRGEYTNVDYSFSPNPYFKNDSYNYFDLFPNIRFTLNINNYNKFSIFYNRRIDRPEEGILRIFPKYDDPELLKIGNPQLRPQYTQNIEIAHKVTWSNGSLYSALYHKNISAYYTRVYIQDPNNSNITIKAYDNLGNATNTGLELTFDQKITKIWNMSGSFNLYKNSISAYSGVINFPQPQSYSIERRTDTPFYVKLNNRLKLPMNIFLEINGIYFSSKNMGQGKELARGGVDLGIKKSFKSNKLELNLSFTDIFNTMGIHQEIESNGLSVEYYNLYETQVLTLGVKYKF